MASGVASLAGGGGSFRKSHLDSGHSLSNHQASGDFLDINSCVAHVRTEALSDGNNHAPPSPVPELNESIPSLTDSAHNPLIPKDKTRENHSEDEHGVCVQSVQSQKVNSSQCSIDTDFSTAVMDNDQEQLLPSSHTREGSTRSASVTNPTGGSEDSFYSACSSPGQAPIIEISQVLMQNENFHVGGKKVDNSERSSPILVHIPEDSVSEQHIGGNSANTASDHLVPAAVPPFVHCHSESNLFSKHSAPKLAMKRSAEQSDFSHLKDEADVFKTSTSFSIKRSAERSDIVHLSDDLDVFDEGADAKAGVLPAEPMSAPPFKSSRQREVSFPPRSPLHTALQFCDETDV